MQRKIFVLVLIAIFVMGLFSINASAQTADFPAGCSSGWGYSVTTGDPCSGEENVINSLPGCSTPLGYSTSNGEPCSGGDVALLFLRGCSSIYGFSTISGRPCNGTNVASIQGGGIYVPPAYNPGAPGLPTTGASGNAPMNILFMIISLTIAVLGSTYLVTKERP